jgi:hypothetical protein
MLSLVLINSLMIFYILIPSLNHLSPSLDQNCTHQLSFHICGPKFGADRWGLWISSLPHAPQRPICLLRTAPFCHRHLATLKITPPPPHRCASPSTPDMGHSLATPCYSTVRRQARQRLYSGGRGFGGRDNGRGGGGRTPRGRGRGSGHGGGMKGGSTTVVVPHKTNICISGLSQGNG